VLAGLLRLHPFRAVYLADLDAIQGCGSHREIIRSLRNAHPTLDPWIDAGLADEARVKDVQRLGTAVIGSESQPDDALLRRLGADGAHVLSLDWRGDAFLGPPTLLSDPGLWPARVIVMTLSRVGVGAGPDLDRLAAIRAAKPSARVFAAGGVRGPDDLKSLQTLGVAGALVATALHDGRLGARDLAELEAM